jgi:ribosomal protein S4
MTKRFSSNYSICKKLKNSYKNIWGLKKKDSCRSVLNKTKKKVTPFGKLLDIKQSLKFFYSNMRESCFKNIVRSSLLSPSKTLDKLSSVLESRLDSILFRSCLVTSFQQARQVISHGHVYVNEKPSKLPSKKINKGDIITIATNNNFFSKTDFRSILNSRSIPNYLELDLINFRIIFLWDGNSKSIYYPIKLNYSNVTRFYK